MIPKNYLSIGSKTFIFWIVIVTVFVFSISLEYVFACSCGGGSLQSAYDNADYVFSGTVKKIENTGLNHAISIDSDRFWKGIKQDKMEIVTASDEGMCGINFNENEDYIIFATDTERGVYTGMCSYTMNLENKMASNTIFLLDTNMFFLWEINFWIMNYIQALQNNLFLLVISVAVIGLSIYIIILVRRKIISIKSNSRN